MTVSKANNGTVLRRLVHVLGSAWSTLMLLLSWQQESYRSRAGLGILTSLVEGFDSAIPQTRTARGPRRR